MTKDNGSNKNRASPQKVAKKKLEFKPLPLNGKTIYLDIKDVRQRRKLEETLKHLGAQVEKFLSKEINYVISSNTTTTLPNKKDGNNDRPDSPSFLSTPSPFNSGQGGSPNCLESTKQKTQTRAQAMVKLAQSQTQTTPVLQNAEKFGIKVIPVDAALKWVTRESSKLQSNTDTSKQQVVKKTTTGIKVKRLRQPLVKFEAVNLHYRPVQLEFDSWPHCNVDTPAGTCPFDGSTVGRAQKTEPEYRDRVVASPQGGQIDKDSVETPKDKTQSKGGQNEGSTSKMVGMQILTAGDLRRRQERKKQVEKKRGYCECCLIKYNDIDKHLRDEDHRRFARDKINFIKLDQIIKTVNSPARFLKKVLHQHCMKKSVNNRKSESVVSGDDVNNVNKTTPQKHNQQIKESEPKQSQPIPCEDEADTKENTLRRRIVTSRRLSSSFSSVRAGVEKDADNKKNMVVAGVSSPRPNQKTKPVVSPCSVVVKSLKNWPNKTKTDIQPAPKVKQKLIIKNMAIGSLQVASTSPDKILRGGDRAAKKQPKDNDSESGISKSVYFSSDYSDSSDTLSDSNTSSNEIIFNKRVRESKVMNNNTETTKCDVNPVRQLRARKKDNSNNFYINKVKLAKRQLTQKTKRASDKMNCLNKLCKIKTNNKDNSRKSLSQRKVRSKPVQSSSQPTVKSKIKSHLIPTKTSLSSPVLKQLTTDAPITSLPINMGEKCLSFAKHSGRKSRNSMEVQLHDMMIFNSLTEIWGKKKKKLAINEKKESSISPGSTTQKTESESNTSILNDRSNFAVSGSGKIHKSIKRKKNRKSENNSNDDNVKDNRLSSRKPRSKQQTGTSRSLQTDTCTSPEKDIDSSSQTTSDISSSGLSRNDKKRKYKDRLIAGSSENKQSNIGSTSQESQVYSGVVKNARNSNDFILKKLKVTIEPLPSCSMLNISSRQSGTRQLTRSSSPYKSVQSGSQLPSATCSSNRSGFLQPPASCSPNKSRSQLPSASCSPNKSKKIIDDGDSQSPVFKKSPVFRPDPKKSQPSRTCRNITPAKPVIFNEEEIVSPKSGISSTPRRRVKRQRKSQIQNFNYQTPSKSEKSSVSVVPTSTTIQNTKQNTRRSLETQLHEIEKSSVVSSADEDLAQTLSHNSKIAVNNYNNGNAVINHPSKSTDSNIKDILNITDESCKTTSTKKRVKLNHSWRVLSDRSVSKLLESERDPAPFLGFEKKDTESCPMSGLSYEEQSEVDLDDSLSSEWIIRSTASNVSDFDDLMPDAYSSPNKRSNSSWFDACEEFLVVKLSSTPSASTGKRVHKKKLKRIGVENKKSKSHKHQNASCVSETLTLRSKADNVLQSIDEDNDAFQFNSPKRKKRWQNEMEQMVDDDIVFNFNSPQKNNQKHSSTCDNSLSSPPSDQPKTKHFRQTPVKSRPSKNSCRSPVKSPPFKNLRRSPLKSPPTKKYKLLKNVADVKAKFNMNYFKKDSRAVKSPDHHSKKQSHLRKLMSLKDKAQLVVVPAPKSPVLKKKLC